MHRTTIVLLAAVAAGACADRPADDAAAAAAAVDTGMTTMTARDPDPTPCTVPGMQNCNRTGEVTFGSQPSPEALESLAAQGFTTIVTTRADGEIDWDERAAVEELGMRFVSIPMPNPVTEITDEQVAQLGAVLDEVDCPILLHCGSGNRVSGLWAAWLVAERGVEPEEALRVAELAGMRSVRPTVERRVGVEPTTP